MSTRTNSGNKFYIIEGLIFGILITLIILIAGSGFAENGFFKYIIPAENYKDIKNIIPITIFKKMTIVNVVEFAFYFLSGLTLLYWLTEICMIPIKKKLRYENNVSLARVISHSALIAGISKMLIGIVSFVMLMEKTDSISGYLKKIISDPYNYYNKVIIDPFFWFLFLLLIFVSYSANKTIRD